jgi:hypothetical protein
MQAPRRPSTWRCGGQARGAAADAYGRGDVASTSRAGASARPARPVPRLTDRRLRGRRLLTGQEGKVKVVVPGKVGTRVKRGNQLTVVSDCTCLRRGNQLTVWDCVAGAP